MEVTKELGLPVLELGCGEGSTPFLREYCKDNKIDLYSFDYNKEWAGKYGVKWVENWEKETFWKREYSVVLVDESPGEHRKVSLSKLHHCKIVIAHDTEPAADHGYKMRAELSKYKYCLDLETNGAWASAVSDYINVTQWKI